MTEAAETTHEFLVLEFGRNWQSPIKIYCGQGQVSNTCGKPVRLESP
ncbi:hypothetical protein [Mycobacterium leprae]|nr:hypothetical protein [Mycobacterium leprae]